MVLASRLPNLVRGFVRMPRARKRLLAESTWFLLRAAWLVRRRPFRTYAPSLGQVHSGEFMDRSDNQPLIHAVAEIRWALKRVNRLAGGRFTCLMLAMAGQRLLHRRGLAATLVLGVRPEGGVGDDPFGAHAWLRAGDQVVIGQEECAGHTAVASYFLGPRAP